MNILFLATDAYGGHGGIAYYNRCLTEALVEAPDVSQVTLLPRIVKEAASDIPAKVKFISTAAGSKRQYLQALAKQLLKPCDLVICGHINLLPLASIVSQIKGVPLVLQVHGIDVWQAPRALHRRLTRQVTAIWSVSRVTRDRMNQWAQLETERYTVIPNTIHLEHYGMALKRPDMLERYGLQGKKVILTLARLDPRERYKGVDEIIESLPALLAVEPKVSYLIAGSGADRARLEQKARDLGVGERAVFAGYVPESEKANLLRLADVFAMPGRGEGFGIVYLEAMACGIPVVGSLLDGSREALRDGLLGELVDPDDQGQIQSRILRALAKPRGIPDGLDYFAWPAFKDRVADATRRLHKLNI